MVYGAARFEQEKSNACPAGAQGSDVGFSIPTAVNLDNARGAREVTVLGAQGKSLGSGRVSANPKAAVKSGANAVGSDKRPGREGVVDSLAQALYFDPVSPDFDGLHGEALTEGHGGLSFG